MPIATVHVDAGRQVGAQGGGSESIAAGEMNVNKFVKLCMFVVLHSVKVVGDP